jgi:periplasmic copper chaperone A
MTRTRRFARPGGLLAAVALAAALLAGCSPGGGASIKVSDAWARTSSAMAAAGAAYMVIENSGSAADALTGAASPAAKTVEVHETVAMESAAPSDGMGSPAPSDAMGSPMPSASGGSGGMMGMQPIARLEIPAGGTVELKPGSYHIMMIGLNQELKVGDKIEITLTFEKAGDVKVTAEVRES